MPTKSKKSSPSKSKSRKKSASASLPRQAAGRAPAKKAGGRGRANTAFMRPMNIKEPLAAIVGNRPLPRTEVVKKVWDYIRKHHLQDSENRRQINADDKLRGVFGGKDQVSMFEMTKLINQNLS